MKMFRFYEICRLNCGVTAIILHFMLLRNCNFNFMRHTVSKQNRLYNSKYILSKTSKHRNVGLLIVCLKVRLKRYVHNVTM